MLHEKRHFFTKFEFWLSRQFWFFDFRFYLKYFRLYFVQHGVKEVLLVLSSVKNLAAKVKVTAWFDFRFWRTRKYSYTYIFKNVNKTIKNKNEIKY